MDTNLSSQNSHLPADEEDKPREDSDADEPLFSVPPRTPCGRNMLQFSTFVGMDESTISSRGRFRRVNTGVCERFVPPLLTAQLTDMCRSGSDDASRTSDDKSALKGFTAARVPEEKGEKVERKSTPKLTVDFEAAWNDVLGNPEIQVEEIFPGDAATPVEVLKVGDESPVSTLEYVSKSLGRKSRLFGTGTQRGDGEPDDIQRKGNGVGSRKGSLLGLVTRSSKQRSDENVGSADGEGTKLPARKGSKLKDLLPKRKGSLGGMLMSPTSRAFAGDGGTSPSNLGGNAEGRSCRASLTNLVGVPERRPSRIGCKNIERRRLQDAGSPLALKASSRFGVPTARYGSMSPRESNSEGASEEHLCGAVSPCNSSARSRASNAALLAFGGSAGPTDTLQTMPQADDVESDTDLAQRAVKLERFLADNF